MKKNNWHQLHKMLNAICSNFKQEVCYKFCWTEPTYYNKMNNETNLTEAEKSVITNIIGFDVFSNDFDINKLKYKLIYEN